MKKDISFIELIEKYTILIPKIQRDYAQGRNDWKVEEIRENFLNEISNILTPDNQNQLVLDFIYGSTTENNVFIPLDGQQRLTTLFLLHWYLCPSDKLYLLQQTNEAVSSKLSYETRISSKDFCNILIKHSSSEIKKSLNTLKENDTNKKELKISDAIKNESWFQWSWHNDPTIKGMLVMLDAIDKKIANLKIENEKIENTDLLWEQLTSNKKISFHILPLEKFKLTSELYVKMNARGKELSSFDILKLTLEEQMERNNIDETFINKWSGDIDNLWMDLFWSKIAMPYFDDNNLKKDIVEDVEKSYLKFLKRLMFYHLYLIKDFPKKNIIDLHKYPNGINSIREYISKNDILTIMPQLTKYGFFNLPLFKFIEETMSQLIHKDGDKIDCISDFVQIDLWDSKIPSNNLFILSISDKITYAERAIFFALIQFSKHFSIEEIKLKPSYQQEINAWMRIMRNLIHNTPFGSEDFSDILNEIESLSAKIYSTDKYQKSILNYFADEEEVNKFAKEQVAEEQEKARQILRQNLNADNIYEMENYAFFTGSIRFLFTDRNGAYNWQSFDKKAIKAKEYFDDKGVKTEYRENARLICSLISQFTRWEQCYGTNKIRIGNGINVWGYIIRNKNLLQPLSDLLNLDKISSSTQENFVSQIESFETGYEAQEKLAHEDMCNNGLINQAIDIMGEGITLNWWNPQFVLSAPNTRAGWKKYIIGNKRNEVLSDLMSRGIITTEQKISGVPYFWGWNIDFKLTSKSFRWSFYDKLNQYDYESESYVNIEGVNISNFESYINSINKDI